MGDEQDKKNLDVPKSLPAQPEYKNVKNIHDPALHHPMHQMDTNGYTGHDELTEQNQKRFNKAAMGYMYHVTSGGHEQCIAQDIECAYWINLVHAYVQVITT